MKYNKKLLFALGTISISAMPLATLSCGGKGGSSYKSERADLITQVRNANILAKSLLATDFKSLPASETQNISQLIAKSENLFSDPYFIEETGDIKLLYAQLSFELLLLENNNAINTKLYKEASTKDKTKFDDIFKETKKFTDGIKSNDDKLSNLVKIIKKLETLARFYKSVE
ncbi:hypothetical protein [Mycoplasma sp. Mirounga ES2805-ORL]|uniref:hypothetical protein n=1 Tax=Mycoplasma sp. Mirounga ES2805-ORL TaxID=754514 RepID=UPI00197BF6E9|nr:hypothetical protein [Mycoplasma sp. Mirounga ES2805-ORL]QSF13860.1 hypothetical protein JXZ90_00980 [Mycoplasma sp. Mirounga ES2805-ORL]